MKIWTYQEAMTKVITDLDLQEIFEGQGAFISPNEMAGYFNEALTEAEAEIQATNQDYFLTKYYVPLVQGQKRYALPTNIFANKIRGVYYLNGSINYYVSQFRRKNKFENIALTDQWDPNAWYMYLLVNDYVGQSVMEIHPPSRETAIMPPNPNPFTPMTMWYIRNCTRIPLIGEFCNPEAMAPSQVDAGADTIQTYAGSQNIGIPQQFVPGAYPGSVPYLTGDAVKFSTVAGSTLPAPLAAGTTYYVIAEGNGLIKLASSRANALNNVALDLTTAGSGLFLMTVKATDAIQMATLLDIPEFTTFVMQWVKCRCYEKEGDPRFEKASQVLVQQKEQMISTLTDSIQDDDNEIEGDFSWYNDLS